MTNTTLRSASMSVSGSPSTAIRSASSPGTMAPMLPCIPSASAASEVIEAIASSGDWPPVRTRYVTSRAFCPCAPAVASVPAMSLSPPTPSARLNTSSLRGMPSSMNRNPASS